MDKTPSKPDTPRQTSPEAPSTMFIQLDGRSSIPSQFRTPGTFTITRLQSRAGLPDRITKSSPVPALLVSISLKSLPSSKYQVRASDKLIPTSVVHPFRSNVIDFDSQPGCWAGNAFDYVHYSVPREGLDDIADDLGFGRVKDYRLAVLEDDLVVAQITKSVLPFLGRNDPLSVLDRTVHPDLERAMAKRMGATTYELDSSHVPMLSQPERVIDVIRAAAKGLQGATATA